MIDDLLVHHNVLYRFNNNDFQSEVILMKGWITIGLCILGIVAFIGCLVLVNMLMA